jgi:hypothetical protein
MRIAKSALIACVGLFLCSCSYPHPLQDDVTGLPLFQIVRKVTCEAKEALDKQLVERGLAWERHAFKQTKKDLKNLTDKILEPRKDETKELKEEKQKLTSRLVENNKELDALMAAAAAEPGRNKFTVEQLKEWRKRILKARAEIFEDIVLYTKAVRGHDRDIRVAQNRIDSATKAANERNEELARYYGHAMAYGFRFKIKEENGLAATASWKLPLIFNSNPGMLTLATSGSGLADTKQRLSERKVNLVATFEDLHGLDCSDAPQQAGRLRALHYPIKGRIGMDEVIEQYFRLLDRARRDQENDGVKKFKTIFSDAKAYTDTITFTTTLAGAASPEIVLNPTLRETFNGSLPFSASREDLHEVSISLKSTGGAKEKEKVTKVQIVSEDGLDIR